MIVRVRLKVKDGETILETVALANSGYKAETPLRNWREESPSRKLSGSSKR